MGLLLGFWRVLGWFADSFFTKYSQRMAFFGEKTPPDSQRTASAGERSPGVSLRTASAGEGTWEISLRLARFGVGTAEISLRVAGFGESSTALGERPARVGGGKRSSKRVARGGRVGAELGRTNPTTPMPTPILGTASVSLLEMPVSKAPTQAEVQAIADKVDELIIIALNS